MTPELVNLSWPTAMFASPAWSVLTLNERRVLDRVAIQLATDGGPDLVIRFSDFAAYGIERHCIAPAIRTVVALGFLQITGKSEFHSTYLVAADFAKPSHDWKAIKTLDQAKQIAVAARQNRNPVRESPPPRPASVRESPPRRPSSVRESPPPSEPVEDDDETIVRRPLLKGRRSPLVDQAEPQPEPEPEPDQADVQSEPPDDDEDEWQDDWDNDR
jgi:hypothetical protein